jgi:hypothetical protein
MDDIMNVVGYCWKTEASMDRKERTTCFFDAATISVKLNVLSSKLTINYLLLNPTTIMKQKECGV